MQVKLCNLGPVLYQYFISVKDNLYPKTRNIDK